MPQAIELEIEEIVNQVFIAGDRVVVTRADDSSDVMHHGTVKYLKKDGWVGIRVDREIVVHEWPAYRIFPEEYARTLRIKVK